MLFKKVGGQYFDEETGLHYNYLWDYDPETRRYLTSDPIGLAGDANPFLYVGTNPLSSSDPFGLYTVYWGGAGLDGAYVDDQIEALKTVGVNNVHRGEGTMGRTILDAIASTVIRDIPHPSLSVPFDGEPQTVMCPEQVNYIGYSQEERCQGLKCASQAW